MTTRGKALESGSDGDAVNVLNVRSMPTVSGNLPDLSRQGARFWLRRRRRQRPQCPVQAHGLGPCQRSRPGLGRHRDAAAGADRRGPDRSARRCRQPPSHLRHPESRVCFMSKFRFDASYSQGARRLMLVSTSFMVLSLAGGCSSIDRLTQIGEKPKLTEIEHPTTQPGYKPVQLPMPKPETVSYAPNSLWRNGSRAFFKDQRAHQVGDIMTVTVNIPDQANFANETQRSRTNKEDSGVTDFLGAKSLGSTVLPGRLLTADATSSSDGKGTIQRQETLQTNVAAGGAQ